MVNKVLLAEERFEFDTQIALGPKQLFLLHIFNTKLENRPDLTQTYWKIKHLFIVILIVIT